MNPCHKYTGILTQIERVIFTCGLGLLALAMVPLVAIAADPQQSGNLLQTADAPSAEDVVQVKTAWSVDRARAGESVALAVVIDIKDGIHINADASQVQPFEDFIPYPLSLIHISEPTRLQV